MSGAGGRDSGENSAGRPRCTFPRSPASTLTLHCTLESFSDQEIATWKAGKKNIIGVRRALDGQGSTQMAGEPSAHFQGPPSKKSSRCSPSGRAQGRRNPSGKACSGRQVDITYERTMRQRHLFQGRRLWKKQAWRQEETHVLSDGGCPRRSGP